ncbi:MAG: DUF2845 domain-containing protein [Smithella sp.]|nr:DUF2845 domain-containing protein [Smithellaceae bacterium]NLA41981.1 DUF2845 domain-containing protein [Smithella sp.]
MKALRIILMVVILLGASAVTAAAFRCGPHLVTTGDRKVKVLGACGLPTTKEIICPRKSGSCPAALEIWYYNCGDNDYIYALTFENGILKKEDTEGKGNGKSYCLGR